MTNKFDSIKDRVLHIADLQGIGRREFCEKIGNTYQNFTGKAKNTPLNSNTIENIFAINPNISLEWLITGKGEAIKSGGRNNRSDFAIKSFDKTGLPLVSIHAVAGFGNANFAISDRDVKDYYIIPKFKYLKVDFMIEVAGSSMYPKYSSGDIIACTIIRESKFIQWNKCHVVATKEQGILVKRLKKGDGPDSILAISDNKDYDPFLIPVNEITGIALVVGVIRLE